MSNEFIQAAEDANRLLAGFSAVATLSAAFAQAGKVQQAQAEAEARLAELQPMLGKAKDDIAHAEQTLRAAELEAKQVIADAETQAITIKSMAQKEATEIVSDAFNKADEIRGQCEANTNAANEHVASITAQHTAISLEVEALESRVEKARAYLAKLQG